MSTDNVTPNSKARSGHEAWDRWPGHAAINPIGAALARDMLIELEGIDSPDSDPEGPAPAERSMLEDWVRQGRPFRNVVAEYAAMAQAAGPEVMGGFYAVLSDYVSIACQGSIANVEKYDRHCEGALEGES